MRRASFWFTATTLSPASRALERGRSVRQYPTHVPDPLSSFAHAVWRFLLRRAAGRYAEHDLSDGIGANSCPCAFHWPCYLLGQPRLSESFSHGAPRGSLWVRQGPSFRSAFLGRIACPTATTTAAHSRHPRATSTLLAETAGQRLHRELVLRFLREISPQESISARHKTTKRGRHGQPARVGCDEDVVLRPRPRNRSQGCESPCCAASKSRPRAGRKPKSHFMQVIPCTSLVYGDPTT